ncbi:MAG: hypothetical protein OQK24_01705 [Magnetovibrio sp.]|nr:hypothetical protein [Magnetovibrio sp.]
MSTIQPPPPPSPPAAQPTPPATATAVKAPPGIQNMTPGQTIQATQQPDVTSQLPPKHVQVQTPVGQMTLQTAVQIPKGATLAMVLNQLTPQPQFLITEINGKPVQHSAQPTLTSLTPQAITQSAKTAPAPVLAQGAKLTATLVRPAFPPVPPTVQMQAQPNLANANQTPQTLPQSTIAQTSGQAATTPATTTPTSVQPTSTPQAGVQSSTPASSGTQSNHPAQQVQLPSGTRFQISIIRVDAPSVAANTPAPSAGGGLVQGATVNGLVTGTTPQGQPIVQTPHATFALETSSKLAEGTRVTVKLETPPTQPSARATQSMNEAGLKETLVQSKSWGQLDEALKSLAHADPARFQQVQQNILPQPGPKLTNQLLFFMSALKGGDFKAWIGNSAARVFERERPGMLNRLGNDFQMMARLADEPQQNDWRLALIPLMSDGALEQIRMYYRNRGGHKHNEGDGDGTRFVLDVELSNIGHLQIDGLMKTDKQKLDLILRTDHPLPAEWRTEMGEIFTLAQEYTGIGGTLAFQAAPGNFVEFSSAEDMSPTPGLFA